LEREIPGETLTGDIEEDTNAHHAEASRNGNRRGRWDTIGVKFLINRNSCRARFRSRSGYGVEAYF
jgi:hypothetical protein